MITFFSIFVLTISLDFIGTVQKENLNTLKNTYIYWINGVLFFLYCIICLHKAYMNSKSSFELNDDEILIESNLLGRLNITKIPFKTIEFIIINRKKHEQALPTKLGFGVTNIVVRYKNPNAQLSSLQNLGPKTEQETNLIKQVFESLNVKILDSV